SARPPEMARLGGLGGMAGTILVLWASFLVALSLIRVLEQVTTAGTASGSSASPAWLLSVDSWLYVSALACVSTALVLAAGSATVGGRLGWAAALVVLDGPFLGLLANGLLGGPVGGPVGASEAFARYHLSLSELSPAGIPIGVVGCLVYLRQVGRRRPAEWGL